MQNEREQAFLWQGGVNRATVNFVGWEGERVGQADVKSARFSRKSVLSSADPQPVTGTACFSLGAVEAGRTEVW